MGRKINAVSCRWGKAVAMLVGLLASSRLQAEPKTNFYVVDTGSTLGAGDASFKNAVCNNVNDIIVDGGCWGNGSMITWTQYPVLSNPSYSGKGSYTCGLTNMTGSSITVYARAVCKTPNDDSKSNYYQRTTTGFMNHSIGSPTGDYTLTAHCDNSSDPVVTGGVALSYGPIHYGASKLVSQYPESNGGSADGFYGRVYYTDGPYAYEEWATNIICKSGGAKSNYEQIDNSVSWSSTPANPKTKDTYCSSSSYKVVSGGCWGTGITNYNSTYPQPNGTSNLDFFHCAVKPKSSGQLGTRILCQKN